jgi:hypothetical protein
MSEEQMQVVSVRLGHFVYHPTRNTNLAQMRKEKIISATTEKHLAKKMPDGLILVPKGAVKAVIEYKRPSALKTAAQIDAAIKQELEVAGSLKRQAVSGRNAFHRRNFRVRGSARQN